MNNLNDLFSEFPSVSAKQWKQKIQVDLKGADYNETLLTHTLEGITIKPFYHSDTFKQLEIPEKDGEFEICQTIFIHDEKTANYLAKDALKRGAESIQFIAKKPFDFKITLKNLTDKTIYFQFLFFDHAFISELLNANKVQPLFLNLDPIGNLAKTGNWFFNRQKDHEILRAVINKQNNNTTIIGVDASFYQNAGANTVQQVAYALAHANEYLNFIHHKKIDSVKKINFTFSVGSNYFFEIAKLRAFRYLWVQLIKEYNLKIEANIFVQPGLRNKTLYDYHVNMLRTTSENMSGILGGTDVISNVSYDALFHKKNEFGERIARNQLIILKEESNIKNESFAKGSYYIEDLTHEIASKALQIFKDIEKNGGFVKQLYKGTIQRKIHENAEKEQKLFDTGELVLLGTNKFTNTNDKMKEQLDIWPFIKINRKQTEIQPVIAKRLSEKLEKERIEKE